MQLNAWTTTLPSVYLRVIERTWLQVDVPHALVGTVLGVHEGLPGTRDGSILIGERAVGVIEAGVVSWVRYADIAGWDTLSKEPIAGHLRLRTRVGAQIDLPFPRADGGAFAFVQFLIAAIKAQPK